MDLSDASRFLIPSRQYRREVVRGGEDLTEEPPPISATSGTQVHEGEPHETAVDREGIERKDRPRHWIGAAYDRTPLTFRARIIEKTILVVRASVSPDQDDAWTILIGDPVSEDTGTTTSFVAGRDGGIGALIQRVRSLVSISSAEAIASRLEALQRLSDEELEGDQPLNAGSLLYFAELLEREPRIKAPIITLTREGNIYASWRDGRNLLSVQFMSDGRVGYVFFAPNSGRPSLTDRRYVQTTIDQLPAELKTIGARDWLRSDSVVNR